MSEYINKMIVGYDPLTGRPQHTVEYPWPDGMLEYYDDHNIVYVISEKLPVNEIYVENNEAKMRPESCWIAPGQPIDVGQSFIIRNLPKGSKVTIVNETYIVDDGIFEFSSDVAETFPYSVECWPYYDTKGVMVFQ